MTIRGCPAIRTITRTAWNGNYRMPTCSGNATARSFGLSGTYDSERYNYTQSQYGNRRANYAIGEVGYTSNESNPPRRTRLEIPLGRRRAEALP